MDAEGVGRGSFSMIRFRPVRLEGRARRCSQVVRQRSAKPPFTGSNPVSASNVFRFLRENRGQNQHERARSSDG
jgi:hypothetical protein